MPTRAEVVSALGEWLDYFSVTEEKDELWLTVKPSEWIPDEVFKPLLIKAVELGGGYDSLHRAVRIPVDTPIVARGSESRDPVFQRADRLDQPTETGPREIAQPTQKPVEEKKQETSIARVEKADVLASLSVAKQVLAETKDFTTIINIRDTAVAAKAWASARGADEAAQLALEVKLRSERKAGQFIADMKEAGILNKGGNPKLTGNMMLPVAPTLKSLGVEKIESQRWQRIAGIPEQDFEDYITKAKTRTQAALLALTAWRSHEDKPMPAGVFDVILADPPWQYDFSLSTKGDPEVQYDSMDTDAIAALPIPSNQDAILFLWATNPKLSEALYVMEKWGFAYRTNMVWVKDHWGTGYYIRGQHELLLIGTKGNTHPPDENLRPSSVLEAPRREHSRKPDAIYETIEKMYPNSKRLELFSRNTREGWTSWGD